MLLPRMMELAEAVFVIARSAGSRTVDVTEAVLLFGTRSDSVAVTLAVLTIEPAWFGVTTTVTVTKEGEGREPNAHVTTLVPVQVP